MRATNRDFIDGVQAGLKIAKKFFLKGKKQRFVTYKGNAIKINWEKNDL